MPRQRTILLIDEDQQVLDLLRASLRLKDYRVVTKTDPVEALAYLKKQVPDLIVCDVDLEPLDGFELVNRIREATRASYSPFIFTGAQHAPEKVARGLRMGAREFLRKPFTVDAVLVRVENVFEAVDQARTAAPRFDLEGRIEMLPFAALIDTLTKQRASGRLTISFPVEPVEGILVMVRGEVRHAVFGRLVGREALMQLMTRDEGTFAFAADPHQVAPAVTVEQPAAVLLNEGFRFLDEGLLRRIDVTNRAACRTFERLLEESSGEHLSPDEEVILLTRRIDETVTLINRLPAEDRGDTAPIEATEDDDLFGGVPDDDEWSGSTSQSFELEAEEAAVTDSTVLVPSNRLYSVDDPFTMSAPLSGESDAMATSSIVIPARRMEPTDEDLTDDDLSGAEDPYEAEAHQSVEIVDWGPGPVERIFRTFTQVLLDPTHPLGAIDLQLSTRSGRPLASSVEDRRRREKIAGFTSQVIHFAQRTEQGLYTELSAGDLHLSVVELPHGRLLTCLFHRPPSAEAFLDEVRRLLVEAG